MSSSNVDKIVVAIGIVTLLMLLAGLTNAYKAFGYLAIINMGLYIMLAAATKNAKYGMIAGIIVIFTQATFLTLVFYYWELYYNVFPEFRILGMHPGFFVMFPMWWIVGFAVMSILYIVLFEKVILSVEDIKKFIKKANSFESSDR